MPVGVEPGDDVADVVRVRRDDRIIARLGQILRGPVERLDERRRIVDDHRLLVRKIERRICVTNPDARPLQQLTRMFVVAFAAATTAFSSVRSENTNILMRRLRLAAPIASMIGLAESFGRTISERAMLVRARLRRTPPNTSRSRYRCERASRRGCPILR